MIGSSGKPARINSTMKKQTQYSPPTQLTAPAPQNSNPNLPNAADASKNALQIGGLKVEFPYRRPYGTQMAFMNRVISTLDRAQREGHCHALLESPTGTGKTLSLLCSSLAWQQSFKSRNAHSGPSSKANPEAMIDPINCGGGFIPESQSQAHSQQPLTGQAAESAPGNAKNKKARLAPTIFYASRTHSQIQQVIKEYRRTAYRVPMAVLASRKHYCTNPYVRGSPNLDEQCKLLLKDGEAGCSEFKNAHKVKGHSSVQKGGCNEAHDIEDLVKVGEAVKGCSYFGARSMADDAELVFCPYNYIINPLIRKAMEIDIKGSIIILDEAHNIEDVAREAGSFDAQVEVLEGLLTELEQLIVTDPSIYQPLAEMIQNLFSWIERKKSTLQKQNFEHYFSCWTGDKALTELEEASITRKYFPILQECVTKAIKAASDAEPGVPCLSGVPATLLEGLFSSLSYFFSGDGIHVNDFLLALQRFDKREGGSLNRTHLFSLWCLNPAVVFKGIADTSLSVILTSGTLSPMNSFSSELGVQFGTCLEAPHVVDTDSQLWAGVISRGPRLQNYPLNASYKTAEALTFQDALGTSLEEIFKIVPGGCLVFFPSYKLMDKLCRRWEETGQWSRLNAHKPLFIEPRGGNKDTLEPVLQGYYNSIHQKKKPIFGRKKWAKKSDAMDCKSTESSPTNKREGAAFLAVCRGKISEGIDFSDDNARVVIVVGIPFPNIHDILVGQKKKYNDIYRLSKGLLSGSEWYCNQAFRALNQATGRCIRHRYDYGAIIFLDERFCEERNRAYISKWFRRSIRHHDCLENSLEELKTFFGAAKDHVERVGKPSQISDIKVEEISSSIINKGIMTKHCHKPANQSVPSEMEYQLLLSQKVSRSEGLISINENNTCGSREYIDLDSDAEKNPRLSMHAAVVLSPSDYNLTSVKETPDVVCDSSLMTSEILLNENPSFTAVPISNEIPDQFSSSPVSIVNSSPTLKSAGSVATPKRVTSGNNTEITETVSPWNLSVNSCLQKRRKSLYSASDSRKMEQFRQLARTPDSIGIMESSISQVDAQNSNAMDTEINNLNKEYGGCSTSSFNGAVSVPSSDVVMDKQLQIFCSMCKSPLGIPEHNLHVMCAQTTSSKVYLRSIRQEEMENADECSPTLPVIISNLSFLDQRLFEGNSKAVPGGQEDGVWCKADGCVYNTIFCPFCSHSTTCLGVQVMATDGSNAPLQDKVLFYSDRLELRTPTSSKPEESSPSSGSCSRKMGGLTPFENFAFSPQQQSLGGWRTTKSKMRLPKRGLPSTSDS